MQYRDFPKIQIPKCVENWQDNSWHNDVTAHSQFDLLSGAAIVLWVAYDDVSLRDERETSKYTLEYQPNAKEWAEDGRVIFYEGDDLKVVEGLAKQPGMIEVLIKAEEIVNKAGK